jgi:biotin transport system ATP-binding protein
MIEVEGLVSRRGETTVLDGVSLRIDDGESIVIAGANGSGKTTLVRHLNGLLEPDSGSVSVDGTPVLDDPVAARTSVGMVFQNPRDCFVAATVGADVAFGPENLGLPREEIDRRVDDALEAVDLVGHRETRIDRLSGGQQARVAIAGALAMEPDHLVLDEPFTGLDQPSRTTLLRRLDSLSTDGTSLIVVTHDLRDLDALVDRIVVLSSGRIGLEVDATDHERLEEFGVRPC